MHVPAYLDRIGFEGAASPTLETLDGLIDRHLATVPFENVDIVRLRRPIVLDQQRHFDKIVGERRGGFCYELNGSFAGLLEQLGYGVTLGYSVWPNSDGVWTAPFEHMVLVATLPDSGERVLVDVGFGASCPIVAIPLRPDTVHAVAHRSIEAYRMNRLANGPDYWRVDVKQVGGDWSQVYDADLTHRSIEDYAERCDYLQTSLESHFTQGLICSLPREDGRVTLGGGQFILTTDGQRVERPLEGPDDELALLHEWFGIDVDPVSYGVAR